MDVAVRRSVGAEGRKADVEEKKRRRGEEGKAGAGRTRLTTVMDSPFVYSIKLNDVNDRREQNSFFIKPATCLRGKWYGGG